MPGKILRRNELYGAVQRIWYRVSAVYSDTMTSTNFEVSATASLPACLPPHDSRVPTRQPADGYVAVARVQVSKRGITTSGYPVRMQFPHVLGGRARSARNPVFPPSSATAFLSVLFKTESDKNPDHRKSDADIPPIGRFSTDAGTV